MLGDPATSSILNHSLGAQVVELADTPGLGSGAVRRVGSSPTLSTTTQFLISRNFVGMSVIQKQV